MKHFLFFLCLFPAPAETLRYNINWPSGLSLGEATLTSVHGQDQWTFDLTIDASVPGFALRDRYHATANPDFCSAMLDKKFTHGHRTGEEQITFNQEKRTATRQTVNGGKSELSLPACAKDALTFLQFARHELAQGRLAPQQQVVFGALYQVRIEYTGTQAVKVGEERVDADRVVASIKGPASDVTVEMFFSKDASRAPVLARVPVAIGTLTVERVR
jgi:Protein of unknown function (DUF3108)